MMLCDLITKLKGIMTMAKEIMGKKYLSDKDASRRYGYSQSWFQFSRYSHTGPSFFKLQGKILYPLEETDHWFVEQMKKSR